MAASAPCQDLCLADAKIDDTETKICKNIWYADGKIVTELILIALRLRLPEKGGSAAPPFETFSEPPTTHSRHGINHTRKRKLLRTAIFADGKVPRRRRRLMKTSGRRRKTAPAFDRLYKEVSAITCIHLAQSREDSKKTHRFFAASRLCREMVLRNSSREPTASTMLLIELSNPPASRRLRRRSPQFTFCLDAEIAPPWRASTWRG